jgi:hypothetical protein
MSTIAYQTSSPLLSVEERQRAAAYLMRTEDSLLQAVAGLTDSQWHFKPAAGRWSVAEILEHLVIIEDRVHGIVAAMPEAPCTDGNRNNAEVERIILTEVPRRSPRLPAPPHVLPSGEKSPAELLKSFMESRAVTIELLETAPALRGHVAPHPILGLWDGYQWIMAAAAHTARHTEQIREVKADGRFPEALAACSGSLH